MPEIKTYKYHKMSKIATLIGKCCNMYLRRRAKKTASTKTKPLSNPTNWHDSTSIIKSLSKILHSYLVTERCLEPLQAEPKRRCSQGMTGCLGNLQNRLLESQSSNRNCQKLAIKKSSRWFQPIWQIFVKLDHFPKEGWTYKQYVKPPPSILFAPK